MGTVLDSANVVDFADRLTALQFAALSDDERTTVWEYLLDASADDPDDEKITAVGRKVAGWLGIE